MNWHKTAKSFEGGGYVKPITEGYERKGGQNAKITISERPAPPPPMKPAKDQQSTSSEKS